MFQCQNSNGCRDLRITKSARWGRHMTFGQDWKCLLVMSGGIPRPNEASSKKPRMYLSDTSKGFLRHREAMHCLPRPQKASRIKNLHCNLLSDVFDKTRLPA